jgi:2-polyprenyl-6-methoxyphenol hydroxylase-like FAD-dependent oxidoreductase
VIAARHAEIAGAGIAGLAVATALAQHGWTVRVHERFPEVREVGAGIALGRNGVEALTALGALDEAVADGQAISRWTIIDQWGRTVQRGDIDGPYMYSATRKSLQRALFNSAQRAGAQVVVGSQVAGADAGGLLLEDGSRHPGDLIVGADGVGSRVRRSLQERGVRSRRIDLDVASLRYVIPRLPGDPVTEMPEWLHGNRRVGLLPLAGDRIAMYMFCPSGDAAGRVLPIDVENWSACFPHLRGVFERLPREGTWLPVVETRSRSWAEGSTVLIGDAAYSMAPNLGQGGCTALHSAVTLAEAVDGNEPVARGLQRWELAERPYVDYVQTWSRRYSRMVSQWPVWGVRVRSVTFAALGRSARLNSRFAGVDQRGPVPAGRAA